jgi:hypothetical protein
MMRGIKTSIFIHLAAVVPIPVFPEANHPIVKSLAQQSDQELLTLFQRYPETGQYFVALFCRYSPMLYPVVERTAISPIKTDYLFALVWRHLFNQLSGLDLTQLQAGLNFQSWLLNATAAHMNQVEMPPIEDIYYDIKAASPPFKPSTGAKPASPPTSKPKAKSSPPPKSANASSKAINYWRNIYPKIFVLFT